MLLSDLSGGGFFLIDGVAGVQEGFGVLNQEQSGLLRAILENPQEDSLRLIYADWLEERGHGERANFIRLQMKIASYGEHYELGYDYDMIYSLSEEDVSRIISYADLPGKETPTHETLEYTKLKEQERKILERYEQDWTPSFLSPFLVAADCLRWRRGFVDQITLSVADFFQHSDCLLYRPGISETVLTEVHPIRKVVLTTRLHLVHPSQEMIKHMWPKVEFVCFE